MARLSQGANHKQGDYLMRKIEAIKKFFESGPSGRKVEAQELKALTPDERTELATLACEAMGETLEMA